MHLLQTKHLTYEFHDLKRIHHLDTFFYKKKTAKYIIYNILEKQHWSGQLCSCTHHTVHI
jgi:hypothetical protein